MGQQLALYRGHSSGRKPFLPAPLGRRVSQPRPAQTGRRPCAACRTKEARYGFRDEANPVAERPRTLCFECFRVEIGRRQAVAARLARGWNATQAHLPLADTLERLDRRRRRAQIAARHALGL